MLRPFVYLLILVALSGGFAACRKDTPSAETDNRNNRLGFVVSDNFNLTLFTVGLNYTHYADTLLQSGPYTVLAPSDDAFGAAGYGSSVAIQSAGGVMNQLIGYHILNGAYRLDQLPYAFNQEIRSLSGKPMYVTHWVKNTDTVLTINGVPVISFNLPASNGLVQVLDQVLSPSLYGNVQAAIASDSALTFFNTALLVTGLDVTLRGDGPFTVFAPTNSAFRSAGYPSTDSVGNTDTAVLRAMLNYHILSDRRFIYDYILTTGAAGTSQQVMLNGDNVTITPVAAGQYPGITLQGSGNNSAAGLVRQNVLSGNGVLHTINQVLKENF